MSTTVNTGTGSGGVGSSLVSISISGSITNGGQYGPISSVIASNANSPCNSNTVKLTSGANSLTVPTLASGIFLQPPTNNTQTIQIGSVSVSKIAPSYLAFDNPPPATVSVTVGGDISNVLVAFP